MDCKPTLNSKRRRRAGFTLMETMVSLSIGLMLLTATVALWASASRSFAGDLTNRSKLALDTMSREIRNAQSVLACSPHELVILTANGDELTFAYKENLLTLSEILKPAGGSATAPFTNTLLTRCSSLGFSVFQKHPVGGTYDQYPAADKTTAKVIQIQWSCSRPLTGSRSNTERQISAKVVIRN
jgi:prepilin-type N-terminal cleavage/methylation domain-containing protein